MTKKVLEEISYEDAVILAKSIHEDAVPMLEEHHWFIVIPTDKVDSLKLDETFKGTPVGLLCSLEDTQNIEPLVQWAENNDYSDYPISILAKLYNLDNTRVDKAENLFKEKLKEKELPVTQEELFLIENEDEATRAISLWIELKNDAYIEANKLVEQEIDELLT